MTVVWFVVIGIVGTLALITVSFANWEWWWRIALALAVTIIVTSVIGYSGSVTLGREAWFDVSPFRELLLFALMLLGMAARVVSLAIESSRAKNKSAKRPIVSRWDFIYPMLFAVPTFGALLTQVTSETLTTANVVLAFQTGFFWQTILKRSESP